MEVVVFLSLCRLLRQYNMHTRTQQTSRIIQLALQARRTSTNATTCVVRRTPCPHPIITIIVQVIREAWAGELGQTADADLRKHWRIKREVVAYKDGEMDLQGLYVRPEGQGLPDRIPGVILAHTAVGPQEGAVYETARFWKPRAQRRCNPT